MKNVKLNRDVSSGGYSRHRSGDIIEMTDKKAKEYVELGYGEITKSDTKAQGAYPQKESKAKRTTKEEKSTKKTK